MQSNALMVILLFSYAYIQETLPDQYHKCTTGIYQVLRIGWDIAQSDSSSPANRLKPLALINDSWNCQQMVL
jgi:hypothetical protein